MLITTTAGLDLHRVPAEETTHRPGTGYWIVAVPTGQPAQPNRRATSLGRVRHLPATHRPGTEPLLDRWRVEYAGYGVPLDTQREYASALEAAQSLLVLRQGAGVGGRDACGLTAAERAVLDLAGQPWAQSDRIGLERTARERLGMSLACYYQRLNALLDSPDALAYAPLTVQRLRRLREKARWARSSRAGAALAGAVR